MDKPIRDKAIKSKDDIKEIIKKKKKRGFFIPSKGVTVQADSHQEAIKNI